jgi:pyrroline-5-carboxylate reductase
MQASAISIGFIGGGKMAAALIAALIRAGVAAPRNLVASDISPDRRAALAAAAGIAVTADNAAVPRAARTVILAVKPQQLAEVLRPLAPLFTPEHLVVSIAAGKRLTFLQALLPQARLVRVMPNVACTVNEGMSVFCLGAQAAPADRETVTRLLDCCGKSRELPETLFDAVTALSGSGPAFFAYLLDRLAAGAMAEGLERAVALQLAAQTMLGTARLLLEAGQTPHELIEAVTSARGTTAAGRQVLESSDVAAVLEATVRAAARRSRELSRD